MHSYQTTLYRLLGIALAAAILMGCGAKGRPAEFKQPIDEIKEGPGIFSGEDGEFTVYDSKKGGPFWKQSEEKSAEGVQAAGKGAPPTSDTAAGQTSKEAQVSPDEAKEFQEFQEWKQEKKEFREFLEWKESAKGSAEYREFLEWKEWKSYQEWKKQQGQ
jgi:hypothetical protein